jgi:nicotinamide mononucleotide transporter
MNSLEIAGVISGIVAVWLTTRQKIWCWPIGIISVLLFVVVFFRARLYAAMGLQIIYVGLALYGWYAWTHPDGQDGPLRVSRTPSRILGIAGAAGFVATAGLGLWLSYRTNEALPIADAGTTSFSLVAQWMQTRKWIENWWVWLVVDVVYVGMYLSQGLEWTAGLYAVYVVLAVVGLREWRQALREG